MLASLPAVPDLPALERQVLGRWQRTGVFARSLAATASGLERKVLNQFADQLDW